MVLDKAIFKIGGKILENSQNLNNTISQLYQLLQENIIKKIIIIPGGGSYANFIRELDKELKIGDTMAHWMAIYAMDYNGKIIGKQYPNIKLTDDFEELKKNDNMIYLFLTFKYLKELDELPYSWDITSDSISLYIANKLQIGECYLIKKVDGIINRNKDVIKEINTSNYIKLKASGKLAKIDSNNDPLKKSKPIDNYLIKFVDKYKISCVILNGAQDHTRIYNYFALSEVKDKIFTKISYI